MRATGLGFDELAQTIRGLGQDISTTTTSGINALEMIKNSQVGREETAANIANVNADIKAKGLKFEEDKIKLDAVKRNEAQLDAPIPMQVFFNSMTASASPEQKLQAVNKVPEVTNLLGWKIDENDPNAVMKKSDGTPVSYRDAGNASRIIGAYYTSLNDPFLQSQKGVAAAKSKLQKVLSNVNLGPGLSVDSAILDKLVNEAKAGKLPQDVSDAVVQYTLSKQASDYALQHPREVLEQHISNLTQLEAMLKTGGGDTTQLIEAIKKAQAEIDKLPVSKKAAKITGIEEGTMLNPKEIVTLGGHVAGYNQGIDTEKMRDATMIKTTGMTIAGHERAAASQSDKENKVAFINNYANQMNSAAERASKDAQAIAEKATMSGQQMSPVDVQTLTNQLTAEYQSKVAQNTYDILGKDRMTALQLVIPDTVDQSSAKTRADQAPVVKSIGSYALSLNETDPLRTQIGNQLLEVDRLRRTGDESASQELLTRLTAAVEKYKKAKGENKNRAITEGAKGLHESKTIHSMLFGKDGLFSPGMFIDKTK
jgi:post-segregation antitoxin (ccd killing protein)